MKIVKILFMALLCTLTALAVQAQKKGEKTVTFNVKMHCASCQNKLEKNIPYEKGVKDLKVDLKANTVAVTFKEDKNSAENIQKAIEKLNVPVTGIVGTPAASNAKAADCGQKQDGCASKCCEGKGDKKSCEKAEKKCCQDKK